MGKNGGKRPGAGRPKGGVNPERKELQELISNAIVDKCLDNLLRLADGIKLEKTDKKGQTFVFLTGPDFSANAYLLDQKFGKARQKIDTNLSGGIMLVVNDLTQNATPIQPG